MRTQWADGVKYTIDLSENLDGVNYTIDLSENLDGVKYTIDLSENLDGPKYTIDLSEPPRATLSRGFGQPSCDSCSELVALTNSEFRRKMVMSNISAPFKEK